MPSSINPPTVCRRTLTSAYRSRSSRPLSWWNATWGGNRRMLKRRLTATARSNSSSRRSVCADNWSAAAENHLAAFHSTVTTSFTTVTGYRTMVTVCSTMVTASHTMVTASHTMATPTYLGEECLEVVHWKCGMSIPDLHSKQCKWKQMEIEAYSGMLM